VNKVQNDRRATIDATDEIKKLVPILGKEKAERLETAYLLADEETRKRILEMIDTLKAAIFSDKDLKNSVLMEPPPADIINVGDMEFGVVLYGKKRLYPIMVNKDMFLTHVGIFGSSGYGKTNLSQWLVTNLAKLEVPVIIFDFSKRNYRDLLSLPQLKDKIKIYTVGRNTSPFRFNPLKPPEGIEISQWAKEFSEVFDHAYWMMGGGRHIVLKALDAIYEGAAPNAPKLYDLRYWLEKYRNRESSSREKNWIATAERPLESLCFRETGDVFDCEEGILPSELLKKGAVTILELDSLSTNDKTFFIEIMLQWIRDAALVSKSREKLIGVIILEEAHHVLNREKSKTLGMETVIDLIFREVRELGIGIVYLDQHPSLISYPALGNTSTHIYMNLGLDTKYSSDILDASNMLGLKGDEGDYLRRLPTGHAFMLMRKLSFPNPFLVEFPLVEIQKGIVTDEIIKEVMQGKLIEQIKIAKEVKTTENAIVENKEVKAINIDELDDSHWKMIEILGNFRASATSGIYSLIAMSGSAFKKRADMLKDAGLIGCSIGNVYRQRAIYYFLTDEGEKQFNSKFQRKIDGLDFDVNRMKDFLKNYFTLKGFMVMEDKIEQINFSRGITKISVNLETEMNVEKLKERLKHCAEKEIYFACANEQIKNFVIQQAAKCCSVHSLNRLPVLVGSINELNEGKDFKKIEFQPT